MIEMQISKHEGGKYNSNRDTATIARLIRQDIKEAQKKGTIPATVKVSVTIDRFSGGSSIDVKIKSAPFSCFNPEHYKPEYEYAYDRPGLYTEEGVALKNALEAIAKEYQRSETDISSDYWCNNFYLSVDFHWELTKAHRESLAG